MRIAAIVLSAVLARRVLAQQPALDSVMRNLEAKGFSGVVRVERRGTVLLEKGYGLAIRATGTPFSPNTIVQIGSNTKDFTIVALLQLHERGKLNIRDSLSKFFPSAPADKRSITLWQLATHVAGFPIGLGGDFEPLTRDQFVKAAFDRPLNFAPGKGEQYSNTGYALLAAVIELVSGQTYDEFVRANILDPLGLKNTGLLLPHFDTAHVAHGYRNGEDVGTMLSKPHAADGPYWNLRGNGGMLSTVDDMHTFYKALFESNKLLKPETRALRFHPDEPVGLAGSDMISSFLYDRLPMAGIEIIIASNSTDVRFPAVRNAIGNVLGIPSPDAGPPGASSAPAVVKAPPANVVALLTDFIAAINSGNESTLATFIRDHYVIPPGTATAAERAQRIMGTHQNLGTLTVDNFNQIDAGTVEISLTSANAGRATFKVGVDAGPPARIKILQVMVGG
jgi:CubicO group peptidase (beta-lactamase class C family)